MKKGFCSSSSAKVLSSSNTLASSRCLNLSRTLYNNNNSSITSRFLRSRSSFASSAQSSSRATSLLFPALVVGTVGLGSLYMYNHYFPSVILNSEPYTGPGFSKNCDSCGRKLEKTEPLYRCNDCEERTEICEKCVNKKEFKNHTFLKTPRSDFKRMGPPKVTEEDHKGIAAVRTKKQKKARDERVRQKQDKERSDKDASSSSSRGKSDSEEKKYKHPLKSAHRVDRNMESSHYSDSHEDTPNAGRNKHTRKHSYDGEGDRNGSQRSSKSDSSSRSGSPRSPRSTRSSGNNKNDKSYVEAVTDTVKDTWNRLTGHSDDESKPKKKRDKQKKKDKKKGKEGREAGNKELKSAMSSNKGTPAKQEDDSNSKFGGKSAGYKDQAVGKAKESYGKATGAKETEARGRVQAARGREEAKGNKKNKE